MCSTGINKLDPLCVMDEFGRSNCDESFHYYSFAVNDIPISFKLDAVFYQLTRMEEGVFFARQHFEDGYLLQDFIDLNAYLHSDISACYYGDFASCFETGYYAAWIELFGQNLVRSMHEEGVFEAKSEGNDVTVTAFVPRLPLGAHGFRAAAAYYPVGSPEAAIEVNLDSTETSPTEKVLSDLSPGEYQLELRVYNNGRK